MLMRSLEMNPTLSRGKGSGDIFEHFFGSIRSAISSQTKHCTHSNEALLLHKDVTIDLLQH